MARPPANGKSAMYKTTVSIDDVTSQLLSDMGEGNYSVGVRRLAQEYLALRDSPSLSPIQEGSNDLTEIEFRLDRIDTRLNSILNIIRP